MLPQEVEEDEESTGEAAEDQSDPARGRRSTATDCGMDSVSMKRIVCHATVPVVMGTDRRHPI